MSDKHLAKLRADIAALETTGRGRRYPAALRGRVVAYITGHGQSIAAASRALSIPEVTLNRWCRQAPARKPMRRVVVAAPAHSAGQLTFTSRDGHRVEGLDVSGVAQLIRLLSA